MLVLSLLDSAYWTSSLLLYCRDTPYRLEKRVPLRTSDYYISKYTDCLVRQCTIRPFALTVTRSATSASADSSTFVVTILNGLPRPRGISHTSFIVYLPNLRIKVTVAFWNFTAFCQLVRLIRLGIRFLFVRPRFRYCFFSPKGRPLKLASRYGVRWQLRPVWTFTTDL